jgi:hypothetical protein
MGPRANEITALNILAYRRFHTRSLRAGYCLPFHKAVGLFSMQRCGRPHDKVFGYLGLTNSRIQVDYSLSIHELFVTTLADYLLSTGLITEQLKPKQFTRQLGGAAASDLLAPFLAFELDPFDPIVCLLLHKVAEFFAPGYGKSLADYVMMNWFVFHHFRVHLPNPDTINFDDLEIDYKLIGSLSVKAVKFIAGSLIKPQALRKDTAARQKALAQEDAMMTASESGKSKKYSEWAAYARAISEQLWRRFQESGEDVEGDMDDEAWTLIA